MPCFKELLRNLLKSPASQAEPAPPIDRVAETVEKVRRDLEETIEFERQRRERGGRPQWINLNCGVLSDAKMQAILKSFVSGNGTTEEGSYAHEYPTNYFAPGDEPVWLQHYGSGIQFSTRQLHTTNPMPIHRR